MGCDLHIVIEHKQWDEWLGFGGKILAPRDYGLFAKMAGVRNYEKVIPVCKPKGFPSDASWVAIDAYTVHISDECAEQVGYCSKEDAEDYIHEGLATRWNEYKVTNPDMHTPSWMTADEFDKALESVGGKIDNEFLVILSVLRKFNELGDEARIVFWFDN